MIGLDDILLLFVSDDVYLLLASGNVCLLFKQNLFGYHLHQKTFVYYFALGDISLLLH